MSAHRLAQFLVSVGCLVLAAGNLPAAPNNAADRPDIADDLESGRLRAAEKSLAHYVADNPDTLARFQLGAVQFFSAIERLAQDSYRYGLNPGMEMVPFLRMPVKSNPNPEPVNYEDVRAMIERFVQTVLQAEETLSPITDAPISWQLDLAAVRLDLNGDGQADADETLWNVFRRFALARPPADAPLNASLGLDTADVHWLRGYCHLLAALGEMILAHDHERQFNHTAQLFFADPQTPYASVLRRRESESARAGPFDQHQIVDAIAFIHLANFPLREPARTAAAREHLLAMIEASRKSWDLIEKETDNDREWIPGPGQTSLVEGVAIDRERLAAWRKFLDEAEAVLMGKKLIPFWRNAASQGVNLKKVFTEPKDFDLVLWAQGTAAVPYLEEGELTRPETWAEFQRIFGGRFIGFAIWIN